MAFELDGIRVKKFRRLVRNENPSIRTHDESKPIHLNRFNYTRTAGSVIGVQVGPNQTATTTHGITGMEVRARSTVGTGTLIGVNSQPNAKSSSATIAGGVRAFEANVEVKGTRTVDSDVSALRTFLDVDSTVTVTGKKSVILVATPNVSGWDYLVDAETSAGFVVEAAVGGSQSHKIRVRSGGTEYFIPLHTA